MACCGKCTFALRAGDFAEVLLASLSTPTLAHYFFEKQGIVLQEQQQAEVCLEACEWIERVGRALERGFVITIDYGHEAHSISMTKGTTAESRCLAYHDRQVITEKTFWTSPGSRIWTSHVNFTAIDLWTPGGTSGVPAW